MALYYHVTHCTPRRAGAERKASMHNDAKAYRAIFFDLDGTLLPMDIEEFMTAYFGRISAFMASHGEDPKRFMDALGAGTKAMASHADGRTNEQAFWDEFSRAYGIADDAERERMRRLSNNFYETDFPRIGDGFQPNPLAAQAVAALGQKGYPLVLTTMPMFPRRAVEYRLAWAGVPADAFRRITTYENSHAVKPQLSYYAENLDALGVAGDDVLMVGNHTVEDMSFLELGGEGFLITDHLLDPVGFDLSRVHHGSMADFAAWADALPACANPAKGGC